MDSKWADAFSCSQQLRGMELDLILGMSEAKNMPLTSAISRIFYKCQICIPKSLLKKVSTTFKALVSFFLPGNISIWVYFSSLWIPGTQRHTDRLPWQTVPLHFSSQIWTFDSVSTFNSFIAWFILQNVILKSPKRFWNTKIKISRYWF